MQKKVSMENKTDQAAINRLLKSLSQGEMGAFKKLFKLFYPVLYAYAHKFLVKEEAQEVAQDTLIWLWENRQDLPAEKSLTAYLFSMIHNKSLNLIAKQEAVARAETNYYILHQSLIEEYSLWQLRDLMDNIDKAVANLPDEYRNAFVLYKFKGLSVQEIADVTNVSDKTIYYRINQATKILRVILKDYLSLLHLWLIDFG